MDDCTVSTLHESKNEYVSRLLNILTPFLMEGYTSMLKESIALCSKTHEPEKYLMTFQNFISRVPKWNNEMVQSECDRIVAKSGCTYLDDLITCVHITHLKLLTASRAGQKQKKIDISIPKLNVFIHNAYINVARKLYKSVYLFEVNIQPLQIQKNNCAVETVIQACILTTIRDSIPIEEILNAYLNESTEEETVESIKEEIIYNDIESPEPEPEPELKRELNLKPVQEQKLQITQNADIPMKTEDIVKNVYADNSPIVEDDISVKFTNIDEFVSSSLINPSNDSAYDSEPDSDGENLIQSAPIMVDDKTDDDGEKLVISSKPVPKENSMSFSELPEL
jgi:hypothetical protein